MGKQNLIVTVFGRKGSGKTFLVKLMLAEFPRVVILDTNGEYDKHDATVRFTDLDEAIHYLVLRSKRPTDEPFSMAYTPDEMPGDGLDFLRVAFELENVLVVVDEAHMYCSASQLPVEISKLVRLGRHREISQFYVAQRPATLPRDLTAQSDVVITFQQHEGRDIEYLAQLYGRDATLVKTLGRYEVVIYGDRERAPTAALEQESKRSLTPQIELL